MYFPMLKDIYFTFNLHIVMWHVFHISEVAALGSILLLSSAARGAE